MGPLTSAALAVDVLHAGCQLVSLWLLAARGPLDATSDLWSQALSAATACVPALLLLKWQAPAPDWRDAMRSAWSVARPSVVNAVASLATVQGSQWVVAVAGGAAPVGVQELCRLVIAPLALLAQGAMNALVPHASRLAVRAGPDVLARFYVTVGRAWWAAALAAGAVVGLAPELWLRLFAGAVPAGGPALVRLRALSTMAATLALWPALLLSALRDHPATKTRTLAPRFRQEDATIRARYLPPRRTPRRLLHLWHRMRRVARKLREGSYAALTPEELALCRTGPRGGRAPG